MMMKLHKNLKLYSYLCNAKKIARRKVSIDAIGTYSYVLLCFGQTTQSSFT